MGAALVPYLLLLFTSAMAPDDLDLSRTDSCFWLGLGKLLETMLLPQAASGLVSSPLTAHL